ncbi:thioredoxin [Lachnospiraceae bacterium LCP25S3_G4]
MAAIKITQDNFEQEVVNVGIPVLLDFGASWCGPCQMLAPVIEELADEYKGKIQVGKVDIDESIDLARKYRVLSVPTIVLFQDGKEVKREVGYRSKSEIEEWIK